ncbi:MAG: hypothetical protein QMD09_04025 [Desulfatibacillaceae bacterium]|nr:hypothetical protein [Desulfatibacillaceae bacterium]
MLKPIGVKSMVMGFVFSRNSFSTRKVKPFTSKVSSLSRGSSRASARLGPPHPPSFKNTRMGVTFSCCSKYSANLFAADAVTSNMAGSLAVK